MFLLMVNKFFDLLGDLYTLPRRGYSYTTDVRNGLGYATNVLHDGTYIVLLQIGEGDNLWLLDYTNQKKNQYRSPQNPFAFLILLYFPQMTDILWRNILRWRSLGVEN